MPQDNNQLKKSAFGGAAWKFAERISAQLVSLVVSIVLARILIPDDYSVVSIVNIFFVVCNVLIVGGLNTALIQKKDADELDYATVLHTMMLIAALLYGVMFFCAPAISRLYQKDLLIPIIRVMSLTFFINAFKSVLAAYTSSILDFKKTFISAIIGTSVSAVVGIAMALNGFGAWALVAQQMINAAIDTAILYITTRFRILFRVSWERLKSLFAYGWKIFAASIITVIYDECCPLIVGVKFSGTDLAYYNKGKSFPGLLNSSITDTLSTVLFPVIAKVQDNAEAVLAITRRYMKTASYIVFPLMVGFLTVSENFIVVLLTEKWIEAVPYVQIFCLAYMFNIVQIGNLQAIKAMGRSDIVLILEVIKKSLFFLIIAAFVFLSDSPQMLALSSVLCTLVACAVNTLPNRKLIGYKYRYQLLDILPNLILSVIMGAAVWLVGKLALPRTLLLLLQILVGVITYVLLSLITKNENFSYLLGYCKQFLRKKTA